MGELFGESEISGDCTMKYHYYKYVLQGFTEFLLCVSHSTKKIIIIVSLILNKKQKHIFF